MSKHILSRGCLTASAFFLCASLAHAAPTSLSADVNATLPELMGVYKHLHANPELSNAEKNTSAFMAAKAKALGFEVTEQVGGYGVVAILKNGNGPTVLIRADMDGLPVTEQTGLKFASRQTAITDTGIESGVMHACGHDTHMTAWLGTAEQMVANKDKWSGTLMMILQPAEEQGNGAYDMLQDNLYQRFGRPDYALAFHDSAGLPAGQIGYTSGFALANVDSVDIKIKGIGAHGAYPHMGVDPIVIGSRIVTSLQTLVSREIDPLDSAVVTVGSFRAGTKHNIISDNATLLLTVRSYSDETRQHLLDGIKRIAKAEAMAAGLPDELLPEVTVQSPYTPATYNVPEFTEQMASVFKAELGDDRVQAVKPVMGGEDFGRYYRADKRIQSMIFWVGGVPADKWQAHLQGKEELPSLHSPFWAPDAQKVVETATRALTRASLTLMSK